jgi:hypothetical protein
MSDLLNIDINELQRVFQQTVQQAVQDEITRTLPKNIEKAINQNKRNLEKHIQQAVKEEINKQIPQLVQSVSEQVQKLIADSTISLSTSEQGTQKQVYNHPFIQQLINRCNEQYSKDILEVIDVKLKEAPSKVEQIICNAICETWDKTLEEIAKEKNLMPDDLDKFRKSIRMWVGIKCDRYKFLKS